MNNATFSLCGNPKCIFRPSLPFPFSPIRGAQDPRSSAGFPSSSPRVLSIVEIERNRAEIEPRARSKVEEEAKAAGMDGWSCPPWTMARPLWPRKEEVTSRAPATETDTHSACSSSSAGRPATGNVRRSALPQTKATGRNTFAPDGKTCPPSGNPTRLFVSFLPRCCYYRSAPCNLNLKKKKKIENRWNGSQSKNYFTVFRRKCKKKFHFATWKTEKKKKRVQQSQIDC